MKLKFIAVFSIIILHAFLAFAHESDYEIEVSFENTFISKKSKKIPVKVTIKNNTDRVLNTTGLYNIHFYFAKCSLESHCKRKGDIYTAFIRIPAQRIKGNKSFGSEVNLADLYWKDVKINPNHTENVKNFKTLASSNIYFYAGIKTLEGYEMKKPKEIRVKSKNSRPIVQRKPIYKVVNSNVVSVSFN